MSRLQPARLVQSRPTRTTTQQNPAISSMSTICPRARLAGRTAAAYAVGFLAEIPFMVLPPIAGFSYTGYFPSHVTNGVDYSWLVGLVVSGLVYLVAARSLDLTSERAAIEVSERELTAIDAVAAAAASVDQSPPEAPASG